MRIAIIGAGVAGLAALKHSLDDGHVCETFEQTGFIGGTWKYVEGVGQDDYGIPIHSSMYQDLSTNLPKEIMCFEDFPHRKPEYSYITHEQVLDYINDYAEHFGLMSHIKLYHHVVNVSPLPEGRWSVTVKNLKTDELKEKEYDSVVICVGHYSTPVTPKVPGMESFEGSIIHSHEYRKPDPYVGRRVLIVGSGPSGIDIYKKVAKVAKKMILSRRNPHLLEVLQSSETVIDKPEILQINGNILTFKDESEEELDDIIFCTGYKFSFPFLSQECGLEVEDKFIRYIYKHIINVKYPTMAVIGLPENTPLFPMFCLQIRFYLAYLQGNIKVTKEEMMQDVEKHMDKCKEAGKLPNLNISQDFEIYFQDIAETANIKGMKPAIMKLCRHIFANAFGKFNFSYKILNDDEFEQYVWTKDSAVV